MTTDEAAAWKLPKAPPLPVANEARTPVPACEVFTRRELERLRFLRWAIQRGIVHDGDRERRAAFRAE